MRRKNNNGIKIFLLIMLIVLILTGIFIIVRFVLFGDTEKGSPNEKTETETYSETVLSEDTTAKETEHAEEAFLFKGGYYYSQLNNDEKRIYADLTEGCRSFSEKVEINAPLDELYIAAFAMISDHPELYWADRYSVVYSADTALSVEYDVPDDAREVSARILTRANQILDSSYSGMSEYETVKYFYEWIINNVDYGTNDNDQDIRSVFIDGTSVCAGYSKAFLYLCNLAEIECAYVRGFARSSSHAWNLVRLDGTYYWVDVTWGDPVFIETENMSGSDSGSNINYNYFCVTDEEIFRNHAINLTMSSYGDVDYDAVFSFPVCNDDSLNYYKMEGVYFDTYDSEEIADYIAGLLAEGRRENIEMMFGSAADFDEAYADMFYREESLISRAIERGLPGFFGSYYVEYSSNEDINYIVISVDFD